MKTDAMAAVDCILNTHIPLFCLFTYYCCENSQTTLQYPCKK